MVWANIDMWTEILATSNGEGGEHRPDAVQARTDYTIIAFDIIYIYLL